ncbi:hypothetical protein ONZ45_g13432 [Pleurotus djamor]|nr:hypothetical protein ONZ45_g13432 [Pleurotus djamor]
MTEYDYSPEAYERYIAKQHAIASWVDNTKQYPPANPFVPTTPAVQARSLQRDTTKSSGHSSHHSRSKSAKYDHDRERRDRDRDRDMGRDYYAERERDRDRDRYYYPERPHSRSQQTSPQPTYSQSPSRPSQSRRSTGTSSRSAAPPPSSRHHASASLSHLPHSNRPAASRSQTHIVVPSHGHQPRQKTPTRSNTSPAVAYPPQMGSQPYLPTGKPTLAVPVGGGQYVVLPQHGKRIDILPQSAYAPQAPYSKQPQFIPQSALNISPTSSQTTPSPTKQQPLLKRLFTGLTRGGSNGSKNSGSADCGRVRSRSWLA